MVQRAAPGGAQLVTVKATFHGETHSTEMRTDAFLKSIRVQRRGERYEMFVGPVMIVLPREIGREAVADFFSLLTEEDQHAILKEAEARLL